MNRTRLLALVLLFAARLAATGADRPPNILFCIADDMSYRHTGANGDPVIQTPVFDRVAREGVRFTRAFCSSPSCTPSRAALLTGRPFCTVEESGNLWSTLRTSYAVYPDLLEKAGYAIGFTRKGWGPGDFRAGGRTRNPAGPACKSFAEFQRSVPPGKPWCFWFGSQDPHRPYEKGSGIAAGKKIEAIRVPPFLPDTPEVRSDLADYLTEIERFDREVGEIIAQLEQSKVLDNTIVVMTSDNGMPFPRAKANVYDAGTHMPLAIRWAAKCPGGRIVTDFISHIDLAPTFLEAAGVQPPLEMRGRSLLPLLTSTKGDQIDPTRDRVFIGRERHANVRAGSVGYPSRAIRTNDFLYIRNLAPERWPAGDPVSPPESEIERIYGDIDAGPTKAFMMQEPAAENVATLWRLAVEKRSAEELYEIAKDPEQMINLAGRADLRDTQARLRGDLDQWMSQIGDPRAHPDGDLFDRYPYYGRAARGR